MSRPERSAPRDGDREESHRPDRSGSGEDRRREGCRWKMEGVRPSDLRLLSAEGIGVDGLASRGDTAAGASRALPLRPAADAPGRSRGP